MSQVSRTVFSSVRLNLRRYRGIQKILKVIVERVFVNFRDKNAVFTNFRDKNAVFTSFRDKNCAFELRDKNPVFGFNFVCSG